MLDTEKPLPPDVIVTNIYAERKKISIEEFIELVGGKPDEIAIRYPERFLLRYGSKILIICIDSDRKTAATIIQSVGGEKKDKETTYLYTAAKKIMQQTADMERAKYQYKLSSSHEKIIRWAENSGHDVFSWDEKKIAGNTTIYASTINPKILDNH